MNLCFPRVLTANLTISRKAFNRIKREAIRRNEGNVASAQAEIIATIRKIPNKDEALSILARSNEPRDRNNASICGQVASIPEKSFGTILCLLEPTVAELLLTCVRKLLARLQLDLNDIFKDKLPNWDVLETVFRFVIEFFQTKMAEAEREYVTSPGGSEENIRRALVLFENTVLKSFSGGNIIDSRLGELVDSFKRWLAEQICTFEENSRARQESGVARVAKKCDVCGGTYFSKP